MPPAQIAAIRAEGLSHGQAATIATDLADGIGGRLTWSPNLERANRWAEQQLAGIGLGNVHREPIAERGLSWRQETVWLRMTAPDSMMVVAQAAPWSVGSQGDQQGEAVVASIATVDDFAQYRGRLAGKVVLLGDPRAPILSDTPLAQRLQSEADVEAALAPIRRYFTIRPDRLKKFATDADFRAKLSAFLAAERPAMVVTASRALPHGGDSGLLTVDEPPLPARGQAWRPGQRVPFPILIAEPEAYNRMARLAQGGVPVSLAWRIDVAEQGAGSAANIVAEMPGTDRRLSREVVVVGAHLDSWAAGTGATDNGAGVAMVIEAMRLLRHAGVQPRRTIRVVLYAGEEQGLLGAQSYAETHLGRVPRSQSSEQAAIPVESWRAPVGPLAALPEWRRVAAVFNVDGGSGRMRGVFTGGNNPAMAARVRDWLAPLADLGVARVFDESNWPADQWVFSSIGLPTLSFLQDPLDYDSRAHHTNMDMAERLVPADLAINAVTLATLIAQAATDDERLPRPPLSPVQETGR